MDYAQLLVVCAVSVADLGLGFVVLLRNSRSRANQLFAAAALATTAFMAVNFMCDQPMFNAQALWLTRAANGFAFLTGFLIIWFVLIFPDSRSKVPLVWKLILAPLPVMTVLAVWTGSLVRDVVVTGRGTDVIEGWLGSVVTAWSVVALVGLVVTMVLRYRRARPAQRAQLGYMYLGLTLWLSAMLVLGAWIPLMTGQNALAWLQPMSTLLFVIPTTYAIVRLRLMDVRLVVLRGAAYALLIGLMVTLLVLPVVLSRTDLARGLGLDPNVLFVVAALVAVLAFQPTRHALERVTDRFFFRATYDPEKLLSRLGTQMSSTLDARKLAVLLSGELQAEMRLTFAAVIYHEVDTVKAVTAGGGFSDAYTHVLLDLCEADGILVADDVGDTDAGRYLAECGVRLLAPLVMDREVLGAVALGAKQSGQMYSPQDISFLDILAPEASIAMKNAHLFDEKNQRVRELTALNELAYALGANIELEPVLDAALEKVAAVTAADSGSIMLLDEDGSTLRISASHGIPADIVNSTQVHVGQGIAGWVASSGESLILVDDLDPRFKHDLHRQEIISAICAPIVRKDAVIGVLSVNRKHSTELFTTENLNVVTSFAGQMAVVIENARLYRDLESTILGTIAALAAAVDAKDPYTFGHSNDVTEYAMAIGAEMGLEDDDLQTLRIASTLHDIGKIGIDGAILNKKGDLTDEESAEMRTHPAVGANILASLDTLSDAVPLILFHHERLDGSGYPAGLAGEAIPLGARIISVADAFNAMVSDRPYRTALPADEATGELLANSGTQFDPEVVRSFLRVLEAESRKRPPLYVASQPKASSSRARSA